MQDEIGALRAKLPRYYQRKTPSLPLAGSLTAEDIGRAVVFFASDSARNITGQILAVDCGRLLV
jgi:enoyl-[acyl-carrier-protein] reductase (NADH)